ncbi:MAG: helix-turn-helix domain-containing protein [Melioribacteraceae bacterium]|nr:helix-turn-helix domain-containing protein [Melioribacteraceae bacterium]
MSSIKLIQLKIVIFIQIAIVSNVLGIEYISKNYNINDGLVQSTVKSLFQDKKGFIWIGTENGLSCFDGKEFRNFQKPKDLFKTGIVTIGQLENNNLLILNFDGDLWEFDGESFSQYKINNFDDDIVITDFSVTESGCIIVGTLRNGIFLVNNNLVQQLTTSNGLYHNRIRDIVTDKYNTYIISNGGINLFSDGKVEPLFENREFTLTSVLKDSKGTYWIGNQNDGLYRLVDNEWKREYNFPNIYINGLVENHNGEIWLSSNIGLRKIIVNSLNDVYFFEELNTLFVRSLLVDNESGIWCGTYGRGMFHFKENSFNNFTVENGFPSYFGKILHKDKDDRIWIHANSLGGLIFNGNRFIYLNERNNFPIKNLSDVTETNVGEILLLADNRILKFQESKVEPYIETPVNGRMIELFCDNENNLWLSVIRGGIWKFSDKKWTKFNQIPKNISIRHISQDSKNNIWFASFKNGVFKYDGSGTVKINEQNGLTDNRSNFVYEDSNNNIWVATNDGISIVKNDMVIDTLNTKDGLPGNIVYALGGFENIMLIGTADGLAIFDAGDINFFTTADGLASNEISDGIISIRKGKAWFGSTAGVSAFNVNNYFNETHFSKAYFSSVISDKDTIKFNFLSEKENLSDIEFSSALDFIHLDLSTISYSKDISHYRFKLNEKNKNADWSYSDSKRITIENPVSGKYNLEVETKSFGNDWKTAYSLPIKITDPFYKTALFNLILIFIILSGALGYSFYKKKQKKRNKYKTSSLNIIKVKEIQGEIVNKIEIEQGYKDSKLTLLELSKEIKIPKEHISQVINSEFKINYNDFVNTYRVEEAKKMLEKNGSLNMQILQIAYEVGFNSKSSFNTAFKKFTGLTPTEYKKQFSVHKNQKKSN